MDVHIAEVATLGSRAVSHFSCFKVRVASLSGRQLSGGLRFGSRTDEGCLESIQLQPVLLTLRTAGFSQTTLTCVSIVLLKVLWPAGGRVGRGSQSPPLGGGCWEASPADWDVLRARASLH